jgi:hypothetical protein
MRNKAEKPSEEFSKFDALVGKVIAVPKSAVQEQPKTKPTKHVTNDGK